METDIGDIKTRVTSAKGHTPIGTPLVGTRIQGGLVPWFKKHSELNVGTKVRFECIDPYKRYGVSVV